jgi:glycosyltransferase involved in cell wall biosynthesis
MRTRGCAEGQTKVNPTIKDYEPIQIVSPVHNEGEHIAATLREFYRVVRDEGDCPIHLIICEDGSSDNSMSVLQQLSTELPMTIISGRARKGYSRAVIDGLRSTTSGWVAFIDSDGQCDPADLLRLASLRSETLDVIVGWRNPRYDSWVRRLMSFSFGIVFRLLFGATVRDPSCPYLLISRPGLEKVLRGNVGLLKEGFWWEFSARAVAAKLRIAQNPVRHRRRAGGKTQIYRLRKVPRIAVENLVGLYRLRRELRNGG